MGKLLFYKFGLIDLVHIYDLAPTPEEIETRAQQANSERNKTPRILKGLAALDTVSLLSRVAPRPDIETVDNFCDFRKGLPLWRL